MRRIVTGRRLAIRVDDDTLLAVPPMPANLPAHVRVKVLESVLRRQPGLAMQYVELAEEATNERQRVLGVSAELLSELPNGRTFGRVA